MIYKIKLSDGNREDVIKYILDKKALGKFTVVDVGGSVNGWSAPYIDAVVDFNNLEVNNTNIKHFNCDITHPNSYNEILKYVKENGKFDFCICTHTLEDIMNPVYVCEQICKISNEGYISFPSKFRELSRFEGGNYRGYIHHRWIFKVKDNSRIIAYPKINLIENNPLFDKIANFSENIKDLSFYWTKTIELEYINNNYLGPNPAAVINYYNDLATVN
jgi:hypothetical protein